MKTIPLTQGKFALVDDEDFEQLNRFRWYCQKHGRSFRAMRTARISGKRTTILMHRQILNAKTEQEIDHQDRNDLNNRKENLRFCTPQQNCANARKIINCSSQYKGVSWYKLYKKWYSTIQYNYKTIHLGLFDSEVEAAKTYDRKAKELFGEFACVNFQ